MQQADEKQLNFSRTSSACMHAARHFSVRRRLSNCVMGRAVAMLLSSPFVALAGPGLDEATVLMLSPYDQTVAIELPDSGMQALSVGQSPEGTNAVLIDVLEDRAVFEEIVVSDNGEKRDVQGCTNAADAGCVGAVKETVWIYKAVNGVSRVQRLSRQAPAEPVHEFTRVISSESKVDTATTK